MTKYFLQSNYTYYYKAEKFIWLIIYANYQSKKCLLKLTSLYQLNSVTIPLRIFCGYSDVEKFMLTTFYMVIKVHNN